MGLHVKTVFGEQCGANVHFGSNIRLLRIQKKHEVNREESKKNQATFRQLKVAVEKVFCKDW